jgi:hypothetical protein
MNRYGYPVEMVGSYIVEIGYYDGGLGTDHQDNAVTSDFCNGTTVTRDALLCRQHH